MKNVSDGLAACRPSFSSARFRYVSTYNTRTLAPGIFRAFAGASRATVKKKKRQVPRVHSLSHEMSDGAATTTRRAGERRQHLSSFPLSVSFSLMSELFQLNITSRRGVQQGARNWTSSCPTYRIPHSHTHTRTQALAELTSSVIPRHNLYVHAQLGARITNLRAANVYIVAGIKDALF